MYSAKIFANQNRNICPNFLILNFIFFQNISKSMSKTIFIQSNWSSWLIREIRHRCYISRNSTSDSRIITFVYVQTSTCRKAVPIFFVFFFSFHISIGSLCIFFFEPELNHIQRDSGLSSEFPGMNVVESRPTSKKKCWNFTIIWIC